MKGNKQTCKEIHKAEFDICTSKTQVGWTTKAPTRTRSTTFKQKYRSVRTKVITHFLKPKDDRNAASGVDGPFEAGYRGAKVIRKTQSRWWKQRYNLGRYQGKRRNAIEALKRVLTRELEGKCMAKRMKRRTKKTRNQDRQPSCHGR